jgi:hypothetical protein
MSGSSGRESRTRHGPTGPLGPHQALDVGILIDCCKFWERCPKWADLGRAVSNTKPYRGKVGSFRKSIVVFLSAKDGTARIGSIRTTAAIVTSRAGIRA